MRYETVDEYEDRLKKLRIKVLGEGCYSTVYAHPENPKVVVKLVSEDHEYIKFAKIAMRNPDNPWLPKIYAIRHVKLKDYWSESTIVRQLVFMERLTKAPIRTIRAKVREFARLTDSYDDPRGFDEFNDDDWLQISKKAEDPHLRKAAKIILHIDSGDLHDENVMLLGNQLVFTDPVAT